MRIGLGLRVASFLEIKILYSSGNIIQTIRRRKVLILEGFRFLKLVEQETGIYGTPNLSLSGIQNIFNFYNFSSSSYRNINTCSMFMQNSSYFFIVYTEVYILFHCLYRNIYTFSLFIQKYIYFFIVYTEI